DSNKSQKSQLHERMFSQKNLTVQIITKKVKKVLLIGRTGSGKSTLANVLVGKEKQFAVSSSSGSLTKSAQSGLFEENGVLYQVIDTVGLCDTAMTKDKVLSELAETCRMLGGGLYRILLVTGDRFTEEEKEMHYTMKETIFDHKFVHYTTIIRTKFPKCKDIVFVDNPPLTGLPKSIEANKEVREYSRKKIIESFIPNCEKYTPPALKEVSEKLVSCFMEKKKLEKGLKEVEEKERRIKELEYEIKELEDVIKENAKNDRFFRCTIL
ncbi:17161_t:CDS:2, partial [Gigaspora margarita]